MKNLTLVFLLLFFYSGLKSQEYQHHQDSNLQCIQREFSVYVFVLKDRNGNANISDKKIDTLFLNLNKAFKPICFKFVKCNVNYISEYAFDSIGSERRLESIVSKHKKSGYINLFLVREVGFENSYSIFGGAFQKNEGIAVVPKSGSGLVHEFGHLFGLLHTFETNRGVELVNRDNCNNTGDLLCDTPADPLSGGGHPKLFLDSNCNFSSTKKDSKGDYYLTEVGNYMTHYYCAHCFFTYGQYDKMVKNYLNASFKML